MIDFFRDMNRRLDEYLSPAVKTILLINVFVFLAINILNSFKNGFTDEFLGVAAQVPRYTFINPWTVLSYAFVHVDGMHVLFNMLTLWFFGPPIENRWGTRYFWVFYLTTAVAAGLLNALGSLMFPALFGPDMQRVIGASGALNAIFFAFAVYYPEVPVFLFGVLPIPAKYVMALLIGFDILFMQTGDRVSHGAHIFGLLAGFVLLVIRHRDPDIRNWRWGDR